MLQFRNVRGVIGCEQVVHELSAYFDWDLAPFWRVTIERRLRGCRNCAAVYDGVRNLLVLITDNQTIISLPVGLSDRLYRMLKRQSITRSQLGHLL